MSLTPEQYALAKSVFHHVLTLPKSDREAYIARECGADEEVRKEIESLLSYSNETRRNSKSYEPLRILPDLASRSPAHHTLKTLRKFRFFRLLAVLSVVAVLLGLGQYGRVKLRQSLENEIRSQIKSILDSNYTALTMWMNLRFEQATHIATDPKVVERVKAIEQIARALSPQNAKALAHSPERLAFHELMLTALKASSFERYALFNRESVYLSAFDKQFVGSRVFPEGNLLAGIDAILHGKNIFSARRNLGSAINDQDMLNTHEQNTWFGVPIRDEKNDVIAALALGANSQKSFDQIIRTGRWGNSGETYAFNRDGKLISESRFNPELIAAGLLEPGQPSALHTELRDPGVNLIRGEKPEVGREEMPLTKAVARAKAQAIKGGPELSGEILDPYRDYRGVLVVGAWRWTPDFNFAMLTEIDAAEALSVVYFIDFVFIVLAVILIILAILAVFSSLTVLQMRPAARIGARLGQYKIVRKIAEGGMGEIYLANHELLKRPTALKVLKPDTEGFDAIKRFETEVRATSRLSHPNTIAIYDYGRTANGAFYYAMEYLTGISLAKLIELEGTIPVHRTLHLLAQVTASLKEAHSLGLIHRDVKPLNIMICRIGGEYDVVKVVDFGLVRNVKAIAPSTSSEELPATLRGTPAYMPPELLRDPSAADNRSDIYSLGVVAYKMLSGRNLFEAPNEVSLFYDIINTKPIPLAERCPLLPKSLTDAIMTCLEKNPQDRPQNIAALEELLFDVPLKVEWTRRNAEMWWEIHDQLLTTAGV